jgi:hypothetical protein
MKFVATEEELARLGSTSQKEALTMTVEKIIVLRDQHFVKTVRSMHGVACCSPYRAVLSHSLHAMSRVLPVGTDVVRRARISFACIRAILEHEPL